MNDSTTDNRMYLVMFVFGLFFLWWVGLRIFPELSPSADLFSDTYGLSAMVGGLIGLQISQRWGGMRSKMGGTLTMFSAGLISQSLGQLVYTYYYLVLHVEVPYPSLGDLGFFGSIPLYMYGIYLLGRASGVRVSMASFKTQPWALVAPLAILGYSYYIFLQGYEFDWSNPMLVLLDFGYPLGQAGYLSLALLTYLLSRKVLGGVMRRKILWILGALCIQYLADYMFLFQVYNDTWVAGGINDWMYLVSYFVMTLALFNIRVSEVRMKLSQSQS